MSRKKTTTAAPDGDDRPKGQPTGKQTERFARTKAALSRENLNRSYYSMADHAWYGMADVWWALTHPHKAIARHVGQLSMLVMVASAFGAGGYLFFGEPHTAQLDINEPGSILKVALDHTARPVLKFVRGVGGETVDRLSEDETGYQGDDYRE